MLTYKQITEWWKEKENKNKVVTALGFVVIFFVGFGTGKYERLAARDAYKPQNNYTTSQAKKPPQAADAGTLEQGRVEGAATSSSTSANCIIKGNISAAGKKIFHVKGGSFYDRTKAEQCFKTDTEAIAAGFVKSSR